MPFGGKYRIIDFTLSNCVNSDIDDVVVLTQYNPRSLNDHIGLGRPWDLDRNSGGVKLLQPYIARGASPSGTGAPPTRSCATSTSSSTTRPTRPRPRRRPHLQDGLHAVRRRPSAAPRRRHDRRAPRPARGGDPDGDPRPRRQRPGRRVAGEAQAAQERPRLDGRLRLLQEDAPALAVRGPGRLRAARHPGHARGRRPRLRLSLRRLLAGRRHDPVLLGGEHGPPRRRPRPRPLRQGLGDPHPLRGARPGQGRPDRPGPPQPDQPRLRHRRDGRQLDPLAGRPGRRRRGRARLDRHVRLGRSARARSSTERSSTRRSSSARARSSATGPYDDPPNKQEPGRLNTGITVVGKRAVIPRGVRLGRNVKVAADVRTSDFAGRVVRSGESVERIAPRERAGRAATAPVLAGDGRRRSSARRAPTDGCRRSSSPSDAGRGRSRDLGEAPRDMSSAETGAPSVRPADVEGWLTDSA